jgi:hypothetical protein
LSLIVNIEDEQVLQAVSGDLKKFMW